VPHGPNFVIGGGFYYPYPYFAYPYYSYPYYAYGYPPSYGYGYSPPPADEGYPEATPPPSAEQPPPAPETCDGGPMRSPVAHLDAFAFWMFRTAPS
jgi:hypothetical protein